MKPSKQKMKRERATAKTGDDLLKRSENEGEQIIRNVYVSCRNLYSNYHTVLGMWECGYGWYPVLERLSYRLEQFNVWFGHTFGVYVVAVQVKQKFGMLRFYYDIMFHPKGIRGRLSTVFHSLAEKLAPWTWRSTSLKPGGGSLFSRVAFGLGCAFGAVGDAIAGGTCGKGVTVDEVRRSVDELVQKAVGEATAECHDRCEACGRAIGVKGQPRVATTGWIMYVCDTCAKRLGCSMQKTGGKKGKAVSRAGRCTAAEFDDCEVQSADNFSLPKFGKRGRCRG